MSTNLKRHRVRNLKLSEISSVDRPAQTGAVAVLLKRAEDDSVVAIRKDAASVTDGGKPTYGVSDYEDAMFVRADELAAYHHITPELALSKCLTTDQQLRELAYASEVARSEAYASSVRKRLRDDAA